MTEEGDRLTQLERKMDALLQRLETLSPDPGSAKSTGAPDERPDTKREEGVRGTLALTGVLHAGGRRVMLKQEEDLSAVAEVEPSSVSRVFAALGSPFRILLLRALLGGPRTAQELQAELDVGPAGQLYHHLKELLAAGLIVQLKRSVYAIRDQKALLVCIAVVVAMRLASDNEIPPQNAQPTEEPEADS
jgi:DNA-binding transcriptional ArsR family regulator